ncbi:MAG: 3-oxoacid CoA-transferase subunit A [Pseudomonadota bacterium]
MKTAVLATAAAALITDGSVVMVGGFMGVGAPHRVLNALSETVTKDLTLIVNDACRPGEGVGKLISNGQVKKLIVSHIGLNPEAQGKMISDELDVELVPQGTLVERIRAGGFGLGGVLTETGVGTIVASGKQTVDIDGKTFLIEKPLRADFALIAADRSDYVGNLDYSLTAHNFNPIMAMSADVVIAEPQSIMPVGVIGPDEVKTPGVLVDHLIARPV